MSDDPPTFPVFWCLCQNFYKSLKKIKKRVSEGEFPLKSFWGGVPPSEVEKNAIFKLN